MNSRTLNRNQWVALVMLVVAMLVAGGLEPNESFGLTRAIVVAAIILFSIVLFNRLPRRNFPPSMARKVRW